MITQETAAYAGLRNLNVDGSVPESRMTSALEVRSQIGNFIRADDASRAYKRAQVKGLVDGNAPYRQGDLVAAGRSKDCNVNWRISEAYLSRAFSGYYDIFSETPTYSICTTEFGRGQQATDWSAIITEEFDACVMKATNHLDYNMQTSQYDMVLYGPGPLRFRGPLDYRPWHVPTGMLLVPEMSESTTSEWDQAAIRSYIAPDTLYGYIRHEESAMKVGWNPEGVKQSIIRAHPRSKQQGQYTNWEYHQQLLKNSSYYYSAESSTIHMGEYFFREFPEGDEERGRITHAIVDLSPESQDPDAFLYLAVGKFKDFNEIIHPMYLNHGGGGYHHSAIGLGIMMNSAMQYQNKLLCNLADKAFAPKVMFKPTSAAQDEAFNLIQFGDYARVPAGFDMVPVPISGHLEEGMGFNELVTRMAASNLSMFRKDADSQQGNPISATQVNREASEAGAMAKTELNHYYNQLDWLYTEMFRRASNLNIPDNAPGASAVRKFQKRCEDRGVPKQALRMCTVTASRIVGQGNAFLRTQTLLRLLNILPRLPESGQAKLIRDYIASEAGYRLVDRYAPESNRDTLPSEDEMIATLQVNAAKDGTSPVVTDLQNPIIFASIFLKACADILGSLKQNPQGAPKALAFLETIGPAIHKQLDRIKDDPTRADIYKELSQRFAQVAKMTDQLQKQMQQAMKQQQQGQMQAQRAAQIQNGQDPETQLKAAQMKADLQLKSMKVAQDLKTKQQKSDLNLRIKARQARQGLASKDLLTAQTLRHNAITTAESIKQKRATKPKAK